LDNALVCDGDGWVNPPLRFADEPVRHKLLDSPWRGCPRPRCLPSVAPMGCTRPWLPLWFLRTDPLDCHPLSAGTCAHQ
jgi:hypothetical protein